MSGEVTKLRALFGEWEDGSALFLGAIEESAYEAIRGDDEAEGTENWECQKQVWVSNGPHGIEETREATIQVFVDPRRLFARPDFPALATPAGELKERDHGE